MKEMIYEVGSFVLLGMLVVGVLALIQHFFPHLIEVISQYLSSRRPKY